MRCCVFAILALAPALALAYPAHVDSKACNMSQAMNVVTQCWLKSTDGNWMSGTDVLDIQDSLRSADWNKIYEVGKTTKNLTLIAEAMFGSREEMRASALGLGLVLDDAVHGASAAVTRGRICTAIRELLSCGEHHAKQCDAFLTDLLAQYMGRVLGTQSTLVNVSADQIAHMLDKKLCFLCNNEGEALSIVIESMLDGQKRRKLREYMKEDKREQIYQNCPAAAVPAGTKVDKDYVKNLVATNPCAAQPFASCVADDIHKTLNPKVEMNVMGVLTNLTFTEALNCTGVQLPASLDLSKCPSALPSDGQHHLHGEEGAHHHHDDHDRRKRQAGETCDSAKALQDTVQCFISSDAGNKLTGPEGLDIQEGMKNIKWQQVVDAAKKNPGNMTKIREVIYGGKMDKAAGIRMDAALWMDDGVYGENSAAILQDACNGLKAALNCMSNMRPCKARYDRLLGHALHTMSGDYHPPDVNVTGFAKLLDKDVCYLCSNNAEALKGVFKTIIDGEKRKQIKALLYNETARVESYKDCPAASENGRTPDQITKEYMMNLTTTKVCETYPFAKCLADEVHAIANKEVTTSYMADMTAIMYRVLFNCNDVAAPTSGGFDMEQCQTALAPGAE